jgi:hypothetical protein
MARFTHESLTVWWVTTITNIQAPTVAQITAGTDYSSFIPVDGVAFGGTRNNASQAMLGDAFVTEEPGTWGTTLEITFIRDTVTDTAWAFFAGGYKTVGHIVVRRTGTGAAVAAQKVEVYPVTTHEPQMMASAENEYSKFTVGFAVTSKPALEAVVAA